MGTDPTHVVRWGQVPKSIARAWDLSPRENKNAKIDRSEKTGRGILIHAEARPKITERHRKRQSELGCSSKRI